MESVGKQRKLLSWLHGYLKDIVLKVGGGTVDDKVGEDDERDARESSPQPGRRLRGGKVTGCRETGCKEMGYREKG